MTSSTRFILVVDTDQYSGNFERQMCAHITGQIGECEVGKECIPEIEDLEEDHTQFHVGDMMNWMKWFDEHVLQVADDHGCHRPCEIYPTPGRSNNGVGVHYDVTENAPFKWDAYESVAIYLNEQPPKEIFDFMVARANHFHYSSRCKNLNIKNVRLISETTTVTSEVILSVK